MTSSEQIARKARGPQMHRDQQRVLIPRSERMEIERGQRKMDFARYYAMRHRPVTIDPNTGLNIYIDPETGAKEIMEEHYLPVMLSHGNLTMRSVEHDALMNILGRGERVEALAVPKGHRMCGGCGEVKPLNAAHFYGHKSKKDGFQTWCRDCMSEASKKQYSRRKRKKA